MQYKEGGKGGYRSRFTENKTVLSQFTKNITLAFHASQKIRENILENHGSRWLWKSRFTRKEKSRSQEIKRADHGSRKYPLPPSIKRDMASRSCRQIYVYRMDLLFHQNKNTEYSYFFALFIHYLLS